MKQPKKPWWHKYILARARQVSKWDPVTREVLRAAAVGRWGATCAACGFVWLRHFIKVDHINPVVDPAVGFAGWDKYFAELYGPAENRQALCKFCHQEKTTKENKERARVRRAKKGKE